MRQRGARRPGSLSTWVGWGNQRPPEEDNEDDEDQDACRLRLSQQTEPGPGRCVELERLFSPLPRVEFCLSMFDLAPAILPFSVRWVWRLVLSSSSGGGGGKAEGVGETGWRDGLTRVAACSSLRSPLAALVLSRVSSRCAGSGIFAPPGPELRPAAAPSQPAAILAPSKACTTTGSNTVVCDSPIKKEGCEQWSAIASAGTFMTATAAAVASFWLPWEGEIDRDIADELALANTV